MDKQQLFLDQSKTAASGTKYVVQVLHQVDAKIAKTLAYNILGVLGEGVVVFGLKEEDKATLMVAVSEGLTKKANLHAGNMVKEASALIEGGGGGQPFFATAGGKNVAGLDQALVKIEQML